VGERINTHGEATRLRAFCCALCGAFTRWPAIDPFLSVSHLFRVRERPLRQVYLIAGGNCAIMPRLHGREIKHIEGEGEEAITGAFVTRRAIKSYERARDKF